MERRIGPLVTVVSSSDHPHRMLGVDHRHDGTAYHYCGMPQSTWGQFVAASSLGSFYRDRIKGSYDCRTGVVPEY